MKKKIKVLMIIGTRPEILKMLPVYLCMIKNKIFDVKLCFTSQQKYNSKHFLKYFSKKPNFKIKINSYNSMSNIFGEIMLKLPNIFKLSNPDIVLVHGDTNTTLAAAMTAFHLKIKIAHVEAGLRTQDLENPFPEEFNRVVIDKISNLLFAPTKISYENLIKEKIDKKNIFFVGNTIVDTINFFLKKKKNYFKKKKDEIIILITCHRRENFGNNFIKLCNFINNIIKKYDNIKIYFSVHSNPNISKYIKRIVKNERISFMQSLPYEKFVNLMSISDLIITDSGGIQEEAPTLNKKILLFRKKTERPESLKLGYVELLSLNEKKMLYQFKKNIDNLYNLKKNMKNPYGNGDASKKICKTIINHFKIKR